MAKGYGKKHGEEVMTIYDDDTDRFVVSLVVSYSQKDCRTPKEAAAAALALTNDGGCEGTNWYVYDRWTKAFHIFEQHEFAEEYVP